MDIAKATCHEKLLKRLFTTYTKQIHSCIQKQLTKSAILCSHVMPLILDKILCEPKHLFILLSPHDLGFWWNIHSAFLAPLLFTPLRWHLCVPLRLETSPLPSCPLLSSSLLHALLYAPLGILSVRLHCFHIFRFYMLSLNTFFKFWDWFMNWLDCCTDWH